MPLLSLPNEVILDIADFLSPRDISTFLRVNHRLKPLLTPILNRIALQDVRGIPALHWAVKWGHERLVRVLLEKGADINYKTPMEYGDQTALTRAINLGRESIGRLLLEYGADANIRAYDDMPLHTAARRGSETMVAMLLDWGADISARSTEAGSKTPLLIAVARRRYGAVKKLLEYGADVNEASPGGLTPLHFAADFSSVDIARLLLDYGADVMAEDNGLRTPLHTAAPSEFSEGDSSLVKLLLERGADVEAQDYFGATPLSRALEASQRMPLLDFKDIIATLEEAERSQRYARSLELMPVVELKNDVGTES